MQTELSEDRSERERLRSVYAGYARDPSRQRAWTDDSSHRFELERKWTRILAGLTREALEPSECRLLDLGTYTGSDCAGFLQAGFLPEAIIALDLNDKALRSSRERYRWLRALTADAAKLPFRDGAFDLVYQSTMLSSVLEPARRTAILREAGRVLRSGGVFISYDMRYPNPWNRHTRPLRSSEMRAALTGWELRSESLTGIPPITRLLIKVSRAACRLLEAVPICRSHCLVFARKP